MEARLSGQAFAPHRHDTYAVAIADVASACGFADQSHFTRHFKKTIGMTPRNGSTHERSRPD